MNDEILELKAIAKILKHKEDIKANPFKVVPEEALKQALSILDAHLEQRSDFN